MLTGNICNFCFVCFAILFKYTLNRTFKVLQISAQYKYIAKATT